MWAACGPGRRRDNCGPDRQTTAGLPDAFCWHAPSMHSAKAAQARRVADAQHIHSFSDQLHSPAFIASSPLASPPPDCARSACCPSLSYNRALLPSAPEWLRQPSGAPSRCRCCQRARRQECEQTRRRWPKLPPWPSPSPLTASRRSCCAIMKSTHRPGTRLRQCATC